jgi:hypothetical protein
VEWVPDNTLTMTLPEISTAILSALEDGGIETRQIDYKEITDRQVGSLQRPAVNISVNAGNWTKITLDKRKLNVNVSLLLLVQNIKGEKERRFDIYNLMESIASTLFIVSMDLDLQDLLKPVSFVNVTDSRYNDAGYILMQMEFTCSYIYETVKEDLGVLREIVNSYISDDEIIGDERSLTVASIYGGTAWVSNQLPDFVGGRAGTTYWTDEEIWGGYSKSTFTT